MGDFPTDEFDKTEHAKVIGKLWGAWSHMPETDTDTDTVPSASTTYNTKTLWQNVGAQADTLADDLDKALKTLLDGGHGSWEGDAAEEFRKTVNQIVRFTREIAHTADSTYPKPGGEGEKSDSNFETAHAAKSFAQIFTDVDSQLTATQKDEALPAPPYWTTPYWVKWWADFGWDWTIKYEIRKGTGDGSIITPPGGKACYDSDEMSGGDDGGGGIYATAQVKVERSTDGMCHGFLPTTDTENNKLMTYFKFNENEEKTCRSSAKALLEKYGDANKAMPTPPAGLKLTFKSDDPGRFGGGGGGGGAPKIPGGGGGAPKIPGGGGHPRIPDGGDPPKIPGDRDGDGIPDNKDRYPDDPTRGGGDPPKIPGDRDGDGIPDYKDRYPDDPTRGGGGGFDPNRDRDGDGIPDYKDRYPDDPTRGGGGRFDPNRDRDGDGIPDYKDRYPDDPTRGGGPGGGAGNVDTGTSTARAGGFGGGGGGFPSGGIPGGGGVPGSGGIPGGGGLAGGGVPAGAPAGSLNVGGTGAGANGSGGPGAAARSGMGGMMPMMGGGMAGDDGGQEQQRTTWLDEDEDVWGGNDDDAPPPVLGGGF
ncbi:WXG100 family type VII secretion target [Actinopolymorpha singaporensis]